ncbi:MAG: Helix-turn-helix domain [Bacteroidota bacterium]|jgi:ribosome-binding protein aMBF1 (putative translation factor)
MKVFVALLAACLAFGIYTNGASKLGGGSLPANVRTNTNVRSFGEQVRFARFKKGLTAKQLADKVGISLVSLEQVERGQLLPNSTTTHLIEDVLQVRLDSTAR